MSQSASDTLTHEKLEEPRPWQVILHNDDFTPMDFVVEMLMHIFCKDEAEATILTLMAHEQGKVIVAKCSKEVAVSKATHAMQMAEKMDHPLMVTAEPAS